MDSLTDLRLFLLAVNRGLADPARLADAGLRWQPTDGPLSSYLAACGVLTPDQVEVLSKAAVETPQAHPSATPTGSFLPERETTVTANPGTDNPESTPDAGLAAGVSADGTPPRPPGGRYRSLRLHRTGGLGQVWLARDTVVGRDVALKAVRHDRTGRPGAVDRFLREARTTGRLEHPGIVPLYDLIEAGPTGGP